MGTPKKPAAPKPPAAPKAPTAPKPDDAPKAGENIKPPASGEPVKALSVQAKREGFRRAGRAWSKEATVVPLTDLTEAEIEQLRSEPMLTVAEVEIPAVAEVAE